MDDGVKSIIENEAAMAFQSGFMDKDLIFQLLDIFPYPITIYKPDGTIVFANRKFCEVYNFGDPSEILGKFNILRDSYVLDKLGMREFVEDTFQGKVSNKDDFATPLNKSQHYAKHYTRIKEVVDKVSIRNLTGFPLLDNHQNVMYIVITSHPTSEYKGRDEVIKAQEYMNANWRQKFNIAKIAATANLSADRFARVFKQHTKKTPYEYYKHIKIRKLKEAMQNPNFSISAAFEECGLIYNSRYKQFFKESVGISPSEYREKFCPHKEFRK
ncbi:MAG: helix-turn-helix domain-containing protein [Defluviitaleaceae bacterium]|nr:helix-turn-helix domain-containing protein [Defluviitaleaceae bacterium]